MRLIPLYFTLFFISCFVTSCSQKNILFQNLPPEDSNTISEDLKEETDAYYRFKVNDVIQVKFLNSYDFPSTTIKSEGTGTYKEEFQVLQDSTIVLPILGKVRAAGLTRLELINALTALYKPHVNDPIIDVSELGLTARVLGEVNKPGNYPIADNKTHLTELIALAGGFSSYADMKQVLIIRDTDNGNVDFEIDLTDRRSFDLPQLILRDGDTVIARPIKDKNLNEKARTYFFLTSIASVFVSVFLLIDRNR